MGWACRKKDEYHIARRVLTAVVIGGWVQGRAWFGWMDGLKVALGQQKNYNGGCATMLKRSERV